MNAPVRSLKPCYQSVEYTHIIIKRKSIRTDMQLFKLNLKQTEKHTFAMHLAYSVLDGIILGVLALNEFVFIKSLHGTNFQLGFLFQFSTVVFVLLFVFNQFLKDIQNKRRLLLIVGFFTRLPLLFIFFFPRHANNPMFHYLFLLIFFIFFMGQPVILPLINLFLKNSYTHRNFATLYSYATSLSKIVMLFITFIYGLLLDVDNYAFIYVFPIVSILSMVSIYLLSRINYRLPRRSSHHKIGWGSMKRSIHNMVMMLKNNQPYFHFEVGFMLYGISFMISTTVIIIFFNDALHLNYSSVAFYRNSYNIIAILMLPFFGRLLGKIDPRIFAGITFFSMFLYLISIVLTQYLPFYFEIWGITLYYILLAYILFYGIFAATMSLLWSIGSAYFCEDEDAAEYQSVHLTLVGIRSLFAPLAGVWLYERIGFANTFIISCALLIMAIFVMFWSQHRELKSKLKREVS